ncbi:hypothetical protein M422DRAFT_257495 [Sphaerobolus stellatus SS14]|uniref:Uncharacterized protein n=1 Tax=Sphaerobolus stellatus (strain SS14) TaxID=990650 RepID=A0A0C9VP89_SPHS4|nr:hypothetical protein M422DRAFT_257495 [Sphaerobolus stellatus SS14]
MSATSNILPSYSPSANTSSDGPLPSIEEPRMLIGTEINSGMMLRALTESPSIRCIGNIDVNLELTLRTIQHQMAELLNGLLSPLSSFVNDHEDVTTNKQVAKKQKEPESHTYEQTGRKTKTACLMPTVNRPATQSQGTKENNGTMNAALKELK